MNRLFQAFILFMLCSTLGHAMQGQGFGTTGFIRTDQFKLGYIMEGEGRPVIVIGSSKFYARTFSKNLRKHFKFVFLDHRGFVPVPPDVVIPDFTLDKIIDDIEQTRKQLQLGKIMIIGHSGHAYMALEYAKKYPQHVTHLVMIGISPDLSDATEQMIEGIWEESVDPIRKDALVEWRHRIPDEEIAKLNSGEAFIRSYVRDGPKAWFDPYYDCSPLWEGITVNVDMFTYMWGEVFKSIDIKKGLPELQTPIFLALGRYDYMVGPPATWDPFRALFHDLTVRVFEQSGHTPQFEEPELFDAALLKWFEGMGK